MIQNWIQIALFLLVLLACVKPLGLYMARVYSGYFGERYRALQTMESWLFRFCGVDQANEMNWKQYAFAVSVFSLFSFFAVYAIQRLQFWLPLNPQMLPGVTADSSFNTAISFVTNTNWQGYAGESTMSYLTQMLALTVQNFLSAGVGMAVLIALTRGFARKESPTIGNFWIDLTRGVLYILIPLSMVLSIALVSQGVVQTIAPYPEVVLLDQSQIATAHSAESSNEQVDSSTIQKQTIAIGPVASQVAIKQLGTNGGGYFNANSAHPFENPTPLSNFLQLIAILVIPAALCFTFGELVGDRRQGWALLTAMFILLIPLLLIAYVFEQQGNSRLIALEVDSTPGLSHPGGNMEGKEVRFGIVNSVIWSVATTAASNGSVNSMHDSYTPMAGLVQMWLMQLGEVVFGGVGSGLYGMLVFAIVTVFIAGLMVGRTPEYLGKKIGPLEMKLAAIVILLPCGAVLISTACAILSDAGKAGILNPGPHGFSEVLYAMSSASNNNGSAFAGLSANTPYYNALLGIAMLLGRFGVILPVLGIAGSLASKKATPPSPGTLPTHTPLFACLLVTIVIVIGALSFFPALALGPIAEQLMP